MADIYRGPHLYPTAFAVGLGWCTCAGQRWNEVHGLVFFLLVSGFLTTFCGQQHLLFLLLHSEYKWSGLCSIGCSIEPRPILELMSRKRSPGSEPVFAICFCGDFVHRRGEKACMHCICGCCCRQRAFKNKQNHAITRTLAISHDVSRGP